MTRFLLDGREVEAAPGETIWTVAQREGTDIPHLCHRPKPGYRPDGNCRACLVEVEGELRRAADALGVEPPGGSDYLSALDAFKGKGAQAAAHTPLRERLLEGEDCLLGLGQIGRFAIAARLGIALRKCRDGASLAIDMTRLSLTITNIRLYHKLPREFRSCRPSSPRPSAKETCVSTCSSFSTARV